MRHHRQRAGEGRRRVLVFGVGFLDQGGVDRAVARAADRVSAHVVALFGIALLVIGWRLRDKERTYALSVQGGGIAVLYLTIYSSYALYHLLPGTAAFALLLVVTAAAGTLAVLQDASALAVLGIVGGFLAPVLISDGGGNHVALFSYYAILNLAVVGVAWFKAWRALNVLGFAFTFGIGGLWGYDAYAPSFRDHRAVPRCCSWLMYMLIPVLFATARKRRTCAASSTARSVRHAARRLRAPEPARREHGVRSRDQCRRAGRAYVGVATFIYRRGVPQLRVLVEAQFAMGVAFLTVAIPLALDARWTSAAWAVQGAASSGSAFARTAVSRSRRASRSSSSPATRIPAAVARRRSAMVNGTARRVAARARGRLLEPLSPTSRSGEPAARWPQARSIFAALVSRLGRRLVAVRGRREIGRFLLPVRAWVQASCSSAATTLLAIERPRAHVAAARSRSASCRGSRPSRRR